MNADVVMPNEEELYAGCSRCVGWYRVSGASVLDLADWGMVMRTSGQFKRRAGELVTNPARRRPLGGLKALGGTMDSTSVRRWMGIEEAET
jgi:hypothetical protein